MKTKECCGQCPVCGSYEYDVISEDCSDEFYTVECECLDCGIHYTEDYKYEVTYYEQRHTETAWYQED